MHTVIETPAFLASAREEGLDDEARADIVAFLADNPTAGDLMPGTGGARKVRFAGRSKGKSGGYRVITFYGGGDIPIFLLDVFGKGSKANLTAAEKNELKKLLTSLPEFFRAQTKERVAKLKRR